MERPTAGIAGTYYAMRVPFIIIFGYAHAHEKKMI